MESLIDRNFSCLIFFVLMLGLGISSSEAYKFSVGDNDGWVLKPYEDYNHWSERLRFQINDTLYFKYKKGEDSVLMVSKDAYYSCNSSNPLRSFTDGESIVTLDNSGLHFFITGNADHCNKGQRLIVLVLAPRNNGHHHHHQPPPPSPPASTPHAQSPASTPSSSSPASTPHAEAPQSSDSHPPVLPPWSTDAPAPAPENSGSSALGFSVGVSVVLGSLLLGLFY